MERKYFKNQAEIWQSLLSGKQIADKNFLGTKYLWLKNGTLVDNDGVFYRISFERPHDWYEYTEPVDDAKYLWTVQNGDLIYVSSYFKTKEEVKNDRSCLYPVARLNEQTKKVEWI